ncbi:MAG: twin-arginine translocase TatA/TatE family subunit [Alphaproteobacteria bacterium]|nr:twin-arginine translocase TatA/TatE family subunit [Alphaproteobacteria bacterium]
MGLGIGQILIILVIVLVIFGAGKLPRVMSDLGKGLRSFKEGLNEEDSLDKPEKMKLDKADNA